MGIKYMNILFLLLGILLYCLLNKKIEENMEPSVDPPTTKKKEKSPSQPEELGPTSINSMKEAGVPDLPPPPVETKSSPPPEISPLSNITQEGWNSGIKFKDKSSMIKKLPGINAGECLKRCYNNNVCKSADFIEKSGTCLLYKTNCTPSQCDVGDGVSHWMKPISKVKDDPNYLRVCGGAKEFWWFPRWKNKKTGIIGNDAACKKVCDDNNKCDAWLMSEKGRCYQAKLKNNKLRVSCARPGWGKMYGQVKANKKVNIFNERTGEKKSFSGLEAGEAQRLCSKNNLKLENPYDEIKALNRRCEEGGCNLSWKSEGPWKDECLIPDKSGWTCCGKRINLPVKRPPPPPPPEEIDQYNLLPEPQPTRAIGILNKISGHLSGLTPKFEQEDVPVEMKINVDTIPIKTEDLKIKTEASKEGFTGYELNNVREGLQSPGVVFLDKSNSYLMENSFPLINTTDTEVKIKLKQNNKYGWNELKKNIFKSLTEKESKKKKSTKIIERIEGFNPVDFSNFYDETYDFDD